MDEIETLNIELEHRVSKLVTENEHLKKTYKQLYDSIKPPRVQSKEQSVKNDLRKIKGKDLDDDAVKTLSVDPTVSKIDMEPITPKLFNKRTAHFVYIKLTQEEAFVLGDIVEHVKANYPQDPLLESASRYTKVIQDLLSYISKTCPNINNSRPQLVGVTPRNKDKKYSKKNRNSDSVSTKCDVCKYSNILGVSKSFNDVKSRVKSKPVKKMSKKEVWKPTGKVFTKIGYMWRPTGRTFNLVGNACPLTRITTTTEVPSRKPIAQETETSKPKITLTYSRKPRKNKNTDSVSKPKVIKSVSANSEEPSKSWGSTNSNVPSSSLNDRRLGMLQFQGFIALKDLAYLFSVGQFCDSNLEVAFRQHTCHIRNLKGVDLLTGSRGDNLYTLSLKNMMASSPICLLSKASKTKSWLWHRRLSHLNFRAINYLARHGLVRVRLKETVHRIRTDNGTEFVNQTLREYYEKVGISHETSVARSPQQNGVVERRNRTLIEAARTMLIYAKAPLFLWAEAVATA
ncbi:retrovirus-related pol polyprotein from transposon TNT 1-94, partial [Tanacetum coccineum]